MIRKSSKEEVKNCGFNPEAHTVGFSMDGDYYVYELGQKIVSTIRVRTVNGKKLIEGVYTSPQYRHRGIMHLLLNHVINVEYPNDTLFAHCLISSKRIFEDCGFVHYHTVFYKHGTQYFMRLDR